MPKRQENRFIVCNENMSTETNPNSYSKIRGRRIITWSDVYEGCKRRLCLPCQLHLGSGERADGGGEEADVLSARLVVVLHRAARVD